MSASLDRLVYMANQIARNFAVSGAEAAARATADHLQSFWEPRMRARIIACLDAGGAGLSPGAAAAVALLRDHAAAVAAEGAKAGRPDAG